MPLLSLKNDWQPLLFDLENAGEVWKIFGKLQNKFRKALLFNETNHERNELTHQLQLRFGMDKMQDLFLVGDEVSTILPKSEPQDGCISYINETLYASFVFVCSYIYILPYKKSLVLSVLP